MVESGAAHISATALDLATGSASLSSSTLPS